MIKKLFYYIFNISHKSGLTVKKAKRKLQISTHCGIYWNVKAKYDLRTNEVSVYMEGNEKVTLNLDSGIRTMIDYDYDCYY